MSVIETKADELISLVRKKGQVSAKEAAKAINVSEAYVHKLAYVFQKRKLVDLKASAFSLAIIARKK